MKRRHVISLALLLMLFVHRASAQEVRYSNLQLHYSFSLPKNWQPIPARVLSEMSADITKEIGGKDPRYEAGYQRNSVEGITYPYLLIKNRSTETTAFKEITDVLEHAKFASTGSLKDNSLYSDTKVGQYRPDVKRQLVTLPLSSNVTGLGPVRCLLVLKPGRDGFAQLMFYDRESDFETSSKEFDAMLDSFRFDEGYEYKGKVEENGWGTFLARQFVMGLLVVGILWLVRFVRGRFKREETSQTL
jgi:hypothetical protein